MNDFNATRAELKNLIGAFEYHTDFYRSKTRNDFRSTDFIKLNSTPHISYDMHATIGRRLPITTTSSMNRWMSVYFANDTAAFCGAVGTVIRVSDMLRWTAQHYPRESEYLTTLADMLDADPRPRPALEDPVRAREQLLLDYVALARNLISTLPSWTTSTLNEVSFWAKKALEHHESGEQFMPLSIPYPVDFLPPGAKITRDGYGGVELQPREFLPYVVRNADYLSGSEREQIEKAMVFNPSFGLEIAVDGPEIEGRIGRMRVARWLCAEDFGQWVGSVHIDHVNETGLYSTDRSEFAYELYCRASTGLIGFEANFCLVSDDVAYYADWA